MQKLKNEIYQVGSLANQITSTRDNPQRYRVYLNGGVSPALNCVQGGGLNPYVIVEGARVKDEL